MADDKHHLAGCVVCLPIASLAKPRKWWKIQRLLYSCARWTARTMHHKQAPQEVKDLWCGHRVLKLVSNPHTHLQTDGTTTQNLDQRRGNAPAAATLWALSPNRIPDEWADCGWSPSGSELQSTCVFRPKHIKRFKLYGIVLGMKSIDCASVLVYVLRLYHSGWAKYRDRARHTPDISVLAWAKCSGSV